MNTAEEIRNDIANRLAEIVNEVNEALCGGGSLSALKPTLLRLGRGGKLPHWFETLESDGSLPNLDGKSLGSVLEMVFVAVLEQKFYSRSPLAPFRINPARGVDIPDLGLGVKSPSENYCTSEPFFSAYERILGNEHDAVILLTDYQDSKISPPLRIQVINQAYLTGSKIADAGLCKIAKMLRDRVFGGKESAELKKLVRFLAYINQSDWEAKAILRLQAEGTDDRRVDKEIAGLQSEFGKANAKKEKAGKETVPVQSLQNIQEIGRIAPRFMGIVNAADNWVIETQKDFARAPNDNEWERFMRSPLDGKIGMSLALQWRYNFGPLFRTS